MKNSELYEKFKYMKKERIKMNEKDENKKEVNDDDGFAKNIYCWDECMDKDTDWNAIMQPIDWDGEDCMFCPECYKIWDLNYKQIPPRTPHWARKAHAARMALFSEGKEPKHCQHKEREIGNPMKLTGEGCSNEPQHKCEAQNWCNGDWVCGEHWVEHDWHDWSCVICSQEYAVYGN